MDGKVAHFDQCDADTWSPLWLTDFMQQLGYNEHGNYILYWLLPGKNLDTGLRIVDCDKDTLSMIAVVPKFQYFQLFVDHKDMAFEHVLDDIELTGTTQLPPVLSPKTGKYSAGSSSFTPMQQHNIGHELRRRRRRVEVEGEAPSVTHADSEQDSDEDSELDADCVDSDNELAADDDDLFTEWVDENFEEIKKKKSKLEKDSDYDTDLEDLEDSDLEPADSGDEVVVTDKQGNKKIKKKVKLRRWRPENMKAVEFHIGMVFLTVEELRGAVQEYIVKQRVQVHYKKMTSRE